MTALGGLLALDATSVGQFMVSRPLVAGALTGWLVGDPALGVTVGAILELYLLVSFPTGGSRFPEGATATVVAVASAAGASGAGALPLGIALGLVWGQLGGASITLLRQANSMLIPEPDDRPKGPRRLVVSHLEAVGLDYLRGAVVTLSGVLVGRLALGLLAASWPIPARASLGLLLVGGSVSAGVLLHDLGGFRLRKALFVGGMALGLIGARFL